VIVTATLQNPRVSASHLDSVTLTSTASGSGRLGVAIFTVSCLNPYCSSIWSTGGPVLGHPWCERDSDRRIAWGVLATPSITHLLRVVRVQDVEAEIQCPGYLIGATGAGAARVRRDPEDPLPLRQLIILNRDDDIRVLFLTNSGRDPVELRVSESQPEDSKDLDATLEPPYGRYAVFDGAMREESAGAEDAAQAMEEEEDWFDEDEWLQAEAEGAPRAPPGAGAMVVDDGGVSI